MYNYIFCTGHVVHIEGMYHATNRHWPRRGTNIQFGVSVNGRTFNQPKLVYPSPAVINL
jgi:hypothetical protein